MSGRSTFEQLLAVKGISLQELGLREVALHRADALHAVALLRASSVPILGGDVYFIVKGSVEPGFANWHTDQRPGEGRAEFSARSCGETKKYIESFVQLRESTPLFVLVVAE